jgi:argininosuccinate lyase
VKNGSSFRDAYVKIGQEIENNVFDFEIGNLNHTTREVSETCV